MKKTNILITGGAGFIGSHLADSLLSKSYEVFVIDNLSTGSINNIEHLISNKNFHFTRASIFDEIVLDRIASECQTIIHLAAAVGVRLIIDKPVQTIETNINGTEYVLKSALRYGCRVLIASTSEVYGKGNHIPFTEDDDVLLGPTNKSRWSYAASKMVDEFLGLAYYREYSLPVTILRLFNTVGPRQARYYGMVIPTLMHQALENIPLTVYGDGKQSRCFCDVQDTIEAIQNLMNHPRALGHVFNIGSTEEISILELAKQIKNVANSASEIVFIAYDKAYAPGFEDMKRRVPNIEKINALTGWKPRLSLIDTLIRIKDWIENSRKGGTFCTNQCSDKLNRQGGGAK